MLVHPFRQMDVSTSMATGAQSFRPVTSANTRDGCRILYYISTQRTAAVRILPKEFGSSTPPATPLVLQLPRFR